MESNIKEKESYYSSVNKLKKEFYKTVKKKYNLKQQECFDIFDDVLNTITENIYKNEKAKVRGFGTFQVTDKYDEKTKKIIEDEKSAINNGKKIILFIPSVHITKNLNKAENGKEKD